MIRNSRMIGLKSLMGALFAVWGVILSAALPVQASNSEYIFDWVRGDTTLFVVDDDAGRATMMEFRYDNISHRLSFVINLLPPVNNPANYLAKGFSLVLFSNGQYPHFGGGQYAVFYFDGTNVSNPKLTVYPYNGFDNANDSLSFLDAHPADPALPPALTNGIQQPDRICTSLNPSSCPGWLINLQASNEGNGSRTFRFTVDASAINNFPITWPNTAGLPWTGAQFGSQLGFALMAYGHPITQFTYRNDGFIQDLVVPIGADHLGAYGTCLFPQDSHREPYCSGASGSATINAGQAYSTTFKGVSPDNRNLTVNYLGVPSGASVNPANGTTQQGTINGTFNWTPQSSDAGKTFNVDVRYNEDTGITVSCPFSLVVVDNAPKCQDQDVSGTLVTLDSNSATQEALIKQLTSNYVRLAKGTKFQKSAAAYRKQTNKQAAALYMEAWTSIWSVPPTIRSCDANPACVSVSHASAIGTYSTDNDALYQLTIQTNDLIKKQLAKNYKKITNKAKSLRDANATAAASLPTSTTSCS